MSLWSRIIGRERKNAPMTSAEFAELLTNGAEAKSGALVRWNTALEVVTVLACVRVIAEGLSQVPFRLYQDDGRNKQPAKGHKLFDLLGSAPNDFQTSFEFREQLAFHLALCGNAYVYKNTNSHGEIVELLP